MQLQIFIYLKFNIIQIDNMWCQRQRCYQISLVFTLQFNGKLKLLNFKNKRYQKCNKIFKETNIGHLRNYRTKDRFKPYVYYMYFFIFWIKS